MLALLAALFVSAIATMSPSADGTPALDIEPGSGIGGVTIGDSREHVLDAFDDPIRTLELTNELSGATDERLEWIDPSLAVIVAPIPPIDPKHPARMEVTQVETTDPDVRTPQDIGVGSSQADVESTYPEVECDPPSEVVICRLGGQAAGAIVTDFFVEDDAVTRVVVGRIID